MIAFVPALIFVGIAAFVPIEPGHDEILPSYGEYASIITLALALFASLVAPEALCTDRRTGMLDLYLAGPLDVTRYLAAKWATVATRDAGDDGRPAAVPHGRLRRREPRPVGCRHAAPPPPDPDRPGSASALFYTAVAMAVSSLTTRRAVAAVAIVLLLIVPSIVVGVSVDSSGAPDELALLAPGDVAPEFAWRVFGDTRVGSDVDAADRSRLDRARRRGARRLDRARRCRVLASATAASRAADEREHHRRCADRGPRRLEVVRERRRRLRRQLRHRPRDYGAARPERRR